MNWFFFDHCCIEVGDDVVGNNETMEAVATEETFEVNESDEGELNRWPDIDPLTVVELEDDAQDEAREVGVESSADEDIEDDSQSEEETNGV